MGGLSAATLAIMASSCLRLKEFLLSRGIVEKTYNRVVLAAAT